MDNRRDQAVNIETERLVENGQEGRPKSAATLGELPQITARKISRDVQPQLRRKVPPLVFYRVEDTQHTQKEEGETDEDLDPT